MKLIFFGIIVAGPFIIIDIILFNLIYNRANNRQRLLYNILIYNLLITMVISIMENAIKLELIDAPVRVLDTLMYLYFIFHNVIAFIYACYMTEVLGVFIKNKRRFYTYFLIPVIAAEILILTNPIHRKIYYIDEINGYFRGEFLPVLYALSFCYFVYVMYIFIKYKDSLKRKPFIVVFSLNIVLLSGVFIQAINGDFKVELFAQSLFALGLLMVIENDIGRFNNITEVYSQVVFQDYIMRLFSSGQGFSVVDIRLISLNEYKRIIDVNKFNGVLKEIADILRKIFGDDNVFQYDDIHFEAIIKSSGIDSEKDKITRLKKKLLEGVNVGWLDINLDTIIGVMHVPIDIKNIEQVNTRINSEINEVIHGIHVISGKGYSHIERNSQVERAINTAVGNNGFQVYLQPIVDCHTERVVAAEALIRLWDPELGFIPPDEFISLAEKNSKIIIIGQFVFEETCRIIHDYNLKELGVEYVEINLSPVQFLSSSLTDDFCKSMEKYQIVPEQINLEITETAEKFISVQTERNKKDLLDMGFSFSLDDFGTGYSNMVRLLSMEYRNIKFDKSLLWEDKARELLVSLIKMMKETNRSVIQEGVETEEQLNLVRNAGVSLIQGYYFSKPLPASEFCQYVKTQNSTER